VGLEKDRQIRFTPETGSGAVVPRRARRVPTSAALSNLSAVVLLSGSVRTSDLARSIGRSVLDLPIESGTTILGQWRDQAAAVSRGMDRGPLELRVVVDRQSILPTTSIENPNLRGLVLRDPQDYRGSAGVLRDISVNDHEDSYLLVTSGNQVLLVPLEELAQELSSRGGDITLLAGDDGAFMGMMLVRVGAIRGVREVGFLDFKEQVLPRLAREYDVRVVNRPGVTGMPIRTLDSYIAALTTYSKQRFGGSTGLNRDGSEKWFSTFAIQERDANVAASARIHDSVILDGAKVGTNAVIVRSVVSGTGVVRSGQLAADRVVDRSTDLSGRNHE
jgi:hypothetical protein